MTNKGLIKVLLMLLPLILFTVAIASTPIGQVNSTGKAYTLIGKTWNEVKGIYPVVSNSDFKTTEGKMSFLFKDGTRIELGENSTVSIQGIKGDYNVTLKSGKMSFVIPSNSRLKINSSSYIIEADHAGGTLTKVSLSDKNIIGGVFNDGTKVQVVTISGNVTIRNSEGIEVALLTEGNAIEIALNETEKDIMLAQAPVVGAAAVASGATAGVAGGETAVGVLSLMPIVQTSTFKMVDEQYDNNNTASPTSP